MKRRMLWMLATIAAAAAARAGVEDDIAALIPKLADANVGARYEPQMALQAIAMAAAKPGAPAQADRKTVATLLAAKAADATVPQPARVWLLRQLELIGDVEAVPALAAALADSDTEIRETARRALERNPSAEAGKALREALAKGGEAAWRIGLVNSLGQRKDAAAVAAIAAALKDAAVARPAAKALAAIASADALAALQSAYDGKDPALADALVAAAARAGAVPVLQKIFAPGNPAPARAAALTELVRADGASATKRIPEALSDSDRQVRRAAIAAAAWLRNKDLTASLAALLPRLPADAKASVVGVLDASAEGAVVSAAADADEGVRMAAVGVLGRIGTAAAVPALLKSAVSESGDERKAAESALARIAGAGAAEALERAVASGDAPARVAAMSALAARGQSSAIPVLLKAAADADRNLSRGAFGALRQMAGESEIEPLAKLALAQRSGEAVGALKAAGSRAKDPAAVSRRLLAIAQAADTPGRVVLLDAMSATGGAEALQTAVKCAVSPDKDLKEGGVRALANWCDWPAAPELLKVAADASVPENLQILAIRGVARLVQSSTNTPVNVRAESALAAMKAARRDDERKQLLSALAAAPDARALPVVREMIAQQQFRSEASFAAVALAEALVRSDKAAARELAQAAKDANISRDVNKRADEVLKRTR